jgi:hypothetical protein
MAPLSRRSPNRQQQIDLISRDLSVGGRQSALGARLTITFRLHP